MDPVPDRPGPRPDDSMSELFRPGFAGSDELRALGMRVGDNVQISRTATVIGLENIEIGSNVRIDAYCVIMANGPIKLGSYIHIAGQSVLIGGGGIVLEDFAGLSHGVKVYSRTDDYSGACLTNPTVPKRYVRRIDGPVHLGRHVIVGAGSVILPDVTIGEGCAIGALSCVHKSLEPWGIYVGAPARRIKPRSRALLEMEASLAAHRLLNVA